MKKKVNDIRFNHFIPNCSMHVNFNLCLVTTYQILGEKNCGANLKYDHFISIQ